MTPGTLPSVSRTATCVWRVEPTTRGLPRRAPRTASRQLRQRHPDLAERRRARRYDARMAAAPGGRIPAARRSVALRPLGAGGERALGRRRCRRAGARLRASHPALALGRARVLRRVRRGDRAGAARAGRDRGSRTTTRRVGSGRPRPHRRGVGAGEGHRLDRGDAARGAADPRHSDQPARQDDHRGPRRTRSRDLRPHAPHR